MTQTIQETSSPDLAPLRDLLANWQDLKPRNLIAVLQRAQEIYGYLPMEALDFVADTMHIAEARVYGVATFYSQFRLKAQGEHVIQVCNGTACNVKGSEDLLGELVAELGIHAGDTTPDGKEQWVANAQDQTISIIDIASQQVVATIPSTHRRHCGAASPVQILPG